VRLLAAVAGTRERQHSVCQAHADGLSGGRSGCGAWRWRRRGRRGWCLPLEPVDPPVPERTVFSPAAASGNEVLAPPLRTSAPAPPMIVLRPDPPPIRVVARAAHEQACFHSPIARRCRPTMPTQTTLLPLPSVMLPEAYNGIVAVSALNRVVPASAADRVVAVKVLIWSLVLIPGLM